VLSEAPSVLFSRQHRILSRTLSVVDIVKIVRDELHYCSRHSLRPPRTAFQPCKRQGHTWSDNAAGAAINYGEVETQHS
jgi:hypothetical protein